MTKRHLTKYLFSFYLAIAAAAAGSALDRQPNADYRLRRLNLALKTNGGIAIVFAGIESEGPNAVYGFRQDNNFYYLTGWAEPGAALVIAAEVTAKNGTPARPYTEILFLPTRNLVQEKWTGPKLGAEDPNAASLTGFDHVENLDRMPQEVARLLAKQTPSVYADLPQDGTARDSSSAAMDWMRRTNTFPLRTSTHDVKPLLAELRMVKDPGEVERIRHATNASMASHMAALQMLKPGLNEHDIAARMQYEFMKRGCERPAYAPIVGSGINSTVLHYSANDGPIQAGDVVVMDVAGEYAMYASDITRTAPADGKFTARQRELYDIVLGAQQAAIAAFKVDTTKLTGRSSDALYQVAYDYINTHGKDLHGQPLGQYFIHGLGHFVGLDVHDAGNYDIPVPRGAVFTIEPGIYIPEEKIGIRIEDIFWVSSDGSLVNLTGALPHTASEIEAAMTGAFALKP